MTLMSAQSSLEYLKGQRDQISALVSDYTNQIAYLNFMKGEAESDLSAAEAEVAAQEITVADAQTALNTCQSQ